MRAFLDTSVLVAAFWADHNGHEASHSLLAGANRQSVACGLHSLAEVYATLTAMPLTPRLAPEQVLLMVEQIPERLAIIGLTESEYRRTLRDAADLGVSSGRVYDALLVACARKSQAKTIYTWNLKHFQRLAPEIAERIRTPQA